jgi:hypothetical protein
MNLVLIGVGVILSVAVFQAKRRISRAAQELPREIPHPAEVRRVSG